MQLRIFLCVYTLDSPYLCIYVHSWPSISVYVYTIVHTVDLPYQCVLKCIPYLHVCIQLVLHIDMCAYVCFGVCMYRQLTLHIYSHTIGLPYICVYIHSWPSMPVCVPVGMSTNIRIDRWPCKSMCMYLQLTPHGSHSHRFNCRFKIFRKKGIYIKHVQILLFSLFPK